jgi:FkbM family methyltransferase
MYNKIIWKLNWYFRKLLTKLNIKRKYPIGNTYIKLDYNHTLPDNQLAFPYYDRFLPHFVKYLPANSSVVDVGANVGDTLIGMANANANLEYICIEADNNFFNDLKINVLTLLKQFPALKVRTVKQFVGKEIDNIILESAEGTGGTKSAKIGGEIRSKCLDVILSECGIDVKNLSLIKTDVDGFDYDVIRSSYEAMSYKPFIYFECQYENPQQLDGYRVVFKELKDKGYERFAFFDNYGQYMCKVESIEEIHSLLSYIAKQNFKGGSRTIGYYDILAYSAASNDLVSRVLKDYNAS